MAAGLVIDWLGVSWAWIARLRQGSIRKERGWCLVMGLVLVSQRWQWGVAEDVRGEGGRSGGGRGGRGGGLRTTQLRGWELGLAHLWQRLAWPLAGSWTDGESASPPQKARTLTRLL